jgi:hypothetical protein|nr:MAG TPA: protein of unknown function (DUF4364) [Caudoviricetes sp.]
MLAALGSSFFSPTFLLLPIQFLCYNFLKGVINMLSIKLKILELIDTNSGISHIDVLNFLHSEEPDFENISDMIKTLVSDKCIKPTNPHDLLASRYSITPKGKEALLLHKEQLSNYTEQKKETVKTNRRNTLLKFIGAIIMYLLGLFTPEIKRAIISLFEHLFSS